MSFKNSKSRSNGQAHRFVNDSRQKKFGQYKLDTAVDTDSDDEVQHMLERAIKQYKSNKKEEKVAYSPKDSKCEINENRSTTLLNKTVDHCAKELFNGKDMQDLMKYFFIPKKDTKHQEEISKKTLSDYERQGAIPKAKMRNTSKDNLKSQGKISNRNRNLTSESKTREDICPQTQLCDFTLNDGRKKKISKRNILQNEKTNINIKPDRQNGHDKTYTKPFFYIVPQNPSPNFVFPRGSYYVIPKAPESFTHETVIFHPESFSTVASEHSDSEFKSSAQNNRKVQKINPGSALKLLKNMNDLGKDVVPRIDSHLNIGPTQVKEEFVVDNLEATSDQDKIFEKVLISPETSSKSFNVAQVVEDAHEEDRKENDEVLQVLSTSTESHFAYSEQDELITEVNSFEWGRSNRDYTAGDHLHEKDPGNLFDVEYLDYKIREQYERMVKDLPESFHEDLLQKCIEFQGNEEKLKTFIEETQNKIRYQRLVTDMQYIFPDADPDFLSQEVKKFRDDNEALYSLIDQLFDTRDYPKILRSIKEERKKLWLTYVKNFNVKKYLLKVPNPENFAGAFGDNNKATEELIMEFLLSRYPTAPAPLLNQRFISNARNITKTCDDLDRNFRSVKLSESGFDQENFDESFLKEICYIDHRKEIDDHLKTVKEMKEIEAIQARLDGAFLSCPLCSDQELIASEAVTCPEGDVFCKKCIRRYVEIKVADAVYKFACPLQNCDAFFMISTLEEFLPTNVLSVVVKKQQVEEISTAQVDDLEFCVHCDFAYIPNPEDRVFKCQNPSCLAETCRICHEKNHIPLRCEEVERQVDVEARKKIEETMTKKLIRNCPMCNKKFVKIDGCNLISCVCGAKVCYICVQVISGYNHFSNSGCPTYSNNESLHETAVLQAGVEIKNEILAQNPNIRILYDPTTSSEN